MAQDLRLPVVVVFAAAVSGCHGACARGDEVSSEMVVRVGESQVQVKDHGSVVFDGGLVAFEAFTSSPLPGVKANRARSVTIEVEPSASKDLLLYSLFQLKNVGIERADIKCSGRGDFSVLTGATAPSNLKCAGQVPCENFGLVLIVNNDGFLLTSNGVLFPSINEERFLQMPPLATGALDWVSLKQRLENIRREHAGYADLAIGIEQRTGFGDRICEALAVASKSFNEIVINNP